MILCYLMTNATVGVQRILPQYIQSKSFMVFNVSGGPHLLGTSAKERQKSERETTVAEIAGK